MLRFDVFTAVTVKNAIFLDVTLCGSCNNLCFGRKKRLHHEGDVGRSSLLLFTLVVESLRSTEISVLKRATQPNSSEGGIFLSHRHENLRP
jgi:hypothetical protein